MCVKPSHVGSVAARGGFFVGFIQKTDTHFVHSYKMNESSLTNPYLGGIIYLMGNHKYKISIKQIFTTFINKKLIYNNNIKQ